MHIDLWSTLEGGIIQLLRLNFIPTFLQLEYLLVLPGGAIRIEKPATCLSAADAEAWFG